jgi:hypothetical protein
VLSELDVDEPLAEAIRNEVRSALAEEELLASPVAALDTTLYPM